MGRLIKQGSKGVDVRAIQDVLNFHIRRLEPLAVDGIFGGRTNERVIEFQKSNQLKPDGIVGPNTLAKLFAEEQQQISLALIPKAPAAKSTPSSLRQPVLIPPLKAPRITPFFLPPDSFSRIPALTKAGQTITFTLTTPMRSDPVDPATVSFREIMRLVNQLPQNFPFRATIVGAIPQPIKKVGPLALDPVKPITFGFKWGVSPEFDLKSIGPPIAFGIGASVNARYVLKLIDKPGSLVPQLGLFGQGDFKGLIDWTSVGANSKPLVDFKGSFLLGFKGTF
jgi:hypothetical protein